MGLVLHFIVEENIDFNVSLFSKMVQNQIAFDGFSVIDGFNLTESIAITLSLDSDQLHPSIHNLPCFNSFCEINGETYGTTNNGIFKLSGNSDDGVDFHTGVVWSNARFGLSNKKKFRAAIVDGDVDNAVIQAKTDGNMGLYSITRNRASIGRNLIGKKWDFRLVDFDRLEALELIPIVGRRG